jgi:two-component system response regulator DevR
MMSDREIPRRPSTGQSVYLLGGEVVRRGQRQLVESSGLSIAGESGSAGEAVRRIPALRPALVILDENHPDGSGADVCRAIAAAAPNIRCVLMTVDTGEAALIDSILAGAWGCLSGQDDSSEQLRLIRRALDGHTAYSRLFQAALVDPVPAPDLPNERFVTLTRPEMDAVIRAVRGLSNRQISQEMYLAEKTTKEVGFLRADETQHGGHGTGRHGHKSPVSLRRCRRRIPVQPVPKFGRRGHPALLSCTSEARPLPPTDEVRAGDAARLADVLTAVRTGWLGPARCQTARRDFASARYLGALRGNPYSAKSDFPPHPTTMALFRLRKQECGESPVSRNLYRSMTGQVANALCAPGAQERSSRGLTPGTGWCLGRAQIFGPGLAERPRFS